MGSFFLDLLSFDHEVAVFERDPKRMRFTYNCQRFTSYEEIQAFKPELLINAVTLKYTIPVFKEVIPYLPKECIISDIASVKTDLKDFYESSGMRYVSTHPMFGPTFANLDNLRNQNAVIISEGDEEGKRFFLDFYNPEMYTSPNGGVVASNYLYRAEMLAYAIPSQRISPRLA